MRAAGNGSSSRGADLADVKPRIIAKRQGHAARVPGRRPAAGGSLRQRHQHENWRQLHLEMLTATASAQREAELRGVSFRSRPLPSRRPSSSSQIAPSGPSSGSRMRSPIGH